MYLNQLSAFLVQRYPGKQTRTFSSKKDFEKYKRDHDVKAKGSYDVDYRGQTHEVFYAVT